MWELDCEESWAPKNLCFWTVMLEKTLESPLDCKEIQPVHSKGHQPWCSLEGMMLKLKLQYFGHLMWRVDSGKDSDAGRDWGQEEKGTAEDEMAGWHRWLDGHEFKWTPGVGDGQGGLACCDSWGRKELGTTEWLNWTELRGLKIKKKFNLKIIIVKIYLGLSLELLGTVWVQFMFQIILWPSLYFSRSLGPFYVVGANCRF